MSTVSTMMPGGKTPAPYTQAIQLALIKVHPDNDLYILIETDVSEVACVGDRKTVERSSSWRKLSGISSTSQPPITSPTTIFRERKEIVARFFELADLYGSNDVRMLWGDSTYISLDRRAVTRRSLQGITASTSEHEILSRGVPTHAIRVAGNLAYPDFVVGLEEVGLSQDESVAHIQEFLHNMPEKSRSNAIKLSDISQTRNAVQVQTRAMFRYAERVIQESGAYTETQDVHCDAIGVVSTISLMLELGGLRRAAGYPNPWTERLGEYKPQPSYQRTKVPSEEVSAFFDGSYPELRTMHWRDIHSCLLSWKRSGLSEVFDKSLIISLIARGYPEALIEEYTCLGIADAEDIARFIESGIEPDLGAFV